MIQLPQDQMLSLANALFVGTQPDDGRLFLYLDDLPASDDRRQFYLAQVERFLEGLSELGLTIISAEQDDDDLDRLARLAGE